MEKLWLSLGGRGTHVAEPASSYIFIPALKQREKLNTERNKKNDNQTSV